MGSKSMIGALFGVIILGGLGYWALTRDTNNGGEANISAKTMAELVAGKDSFECTAETSEGTAVTKVKGDKMRVEGFNFADNSGGSQHGAMINDGTTVYVWSDTTGSKYKIEILNKLSSSSSGFSGTAAGLGGMYNATDWAASTDSGSAKYSCNKKSINDSDFTPPSNVSFTDLTETLEQSYQLMQTMPTSLPSGISIPTSFPYQ